ncbi:hypothetical protein Ancab_013765 [Ancistrocladus abbreviatus]
MKEENRKAVSPLMGFARGAEIQVAEQDIIKLGGGGVGFGFGAPFMAANLNKATGHQTHLLEFQQIQEEEHRHHHHQQQQISFGMMRSSSSSSLPGNYIGGISRGKDSGAYDLGELDQALFLYLDGQADPSSVQDHQRREYLSSISAFCVSVAEDSFGREGT